MRKAPAGRGLAGRDVFVWLGGRVLGSSVHKSRWDAGKTGMAVGCRLLVDDECCYVDWRSLSVGCAESTCRSVAWRQGFANPLRADLTQDGRCQKADMAGVAGVLTAHGSGKGRVEEWQLCKDTCRLGSEQSELAQLLRAWLAET